MAVSVGDFVRLTAKMKLFGTDDVMNVLTYRVDVNTTPDDDEFMIQAAGQIDAAYGFLTVDWTTDLTFESIDGFNISKNELMPDTPWPVLVNGGNAAILLPTQVAACVFWRTTTPKVRTSAFLGGYVTSALAAGGVIAAPPLGRLATWGASMRLLITATITLTKGSFNPIPLIFTEAGTASVPNRWRTQRRRRIGVGS
jgi:hypothetical protein